MIITAVIFLDMFMQTCTVVTTHFLAQNPAVSMAQQGVVVGLLLLILHHRRRDRHHCHHHHRHHRHVNQQHRRYKHT